MKPIRGVKQEEVWNHWKVVEHIDENEVNWRIDIRHPLPQGIKWFLAEIEESDLENIFIISSNDWKPVSKTFRLVDAVTALKEGIEDDKIKNILEKRKIYQCDIDALDRKFILVSPSVTGNFTIIEGNKRALALLSMGKLVGNQIYLGISRKIKNYHWARYSTRS